MRFIAFPAASSSIGLSRSRHLSPSRAAMAVCLLALSLSACNKPGSNSDGQPATAAPIAALPPATAAPATPMAYAPPVAALPAGSTPIRLRLRQGRDRDAYTDRAYAMSNAFGDTPPDYTVDYDGTRPWVWRSDDGSYRVVEQLPEGQRTYYYQRGASTPFYITDPDGAYAYEGDQLVGIYRPDGTPLADAYAQRWADNAARYYDRSRALYRAVQYSQRQAAYADNWRARRTPVIEQRRRWDEARSRDGDWQAWHDQNSQDEDRDWRAEQDRRSAYAVAIGAAVLGTVGMMANHDGGGGYGGGYGGPNRGAPAPAGGPNYGQRPGGPDAGGHGQRPGGYGPPAGYGGAAARASCPASRGLTRVAQIWPWQCLYFLPDPHGQGALRETLSPPA